MIGYLIFIVPMSVAFVFLARTYGITQALLDLIAFNLFFNFDFAALLPGNLQLSVVHFLGIVFFGYELSKVLVAPKVYLPRRATIVLGIAVLFTVWIAIASYLNKDWDLGRITNYVMRFYVLNALFIVAGIRLAKKDTLARFGKALAFATVVAAVVAIVQTASNGAALTSDQSANYLGIFQPLGEKAIQQRDLAEATINYTQAVRTIRFGSLSFYRAAGPFDGAYAVFCIMAIIALSFLTSKQRVSGSLFIPFFFSVLGFVLAFSRTAVVAFAIPATGIFIVRFRSLFSPKVIYRWLIPVSAAVLFIGVFIQPISTVVAANLDGFFGERGGVQVETMNGRASLWAYVLPQIAESPFIGTGQPITLERAGWGTDNNPDVDVGTHNGFMEFAYRAGVIPALIFALLTCFCLLQSLRLARSKRTPADRRNMFFALAAATTAFFLFNLTAPVMYTPQVAGLFWILCGYLAAYSPRLSQAARPLPSGDPDLMPDAILD